MGGALPLTVIDALLLLACLAAPFALYACYTRRRTRAAVEAKRSGPLFPGPADGTGRQRFREQREDAFVALVHEWGRTFTLDTITVTCDPTLVHTLLNSRAHSVTRSWVYRALTYILPRSDGILFMADDAWRVRHREYTPLFTGGALRSYSRAMCIAAIHEASGACPSFAREGRERGDLLALVRAAAARVLCTWGFGLDAGSPFCRQLAHDLDDYAHTTLEVMPFASPPVLGWLYHYARAWRLAWTLDAHARTIVSDKLYTHDNSNAAGRGSSTTPPPVLNFVTRMRDLGFDTCTVASEINHFHGAHKAIAFVTTCVLFELSVPANAAWRRVVTEELVALCGRPRAPSTVVSPAERMHQLCHEALHALPEEAETALSGSATGSSAASSAGEGDADARTGVRLPPPAELPYGWRPPERADIEAHMRSDDDSARLVNTCRVWKETLRTHVVSMGVMRRTGEAVEHAGVTIPAGHEVQILLHAMHTLPAHWGADASVWDPARWRHAHSRTFAPAADEGQAAAPQAYKAADVFFPFLAGIRRCAGMYLAELEFLQMLYVFLVIFDTRVSMPPDADAPSAAAVIPCGKGRFRLRMAPEMFSLIDGPLPWSMNG